MIGIGEGGSVSAIGDGSVDVRDDLGGENYDGDYNEYNDGDYGG